MFVAVSILLFNVGSSDAGVRGRTAGEEGAAFLFRHDDTTHSRWSNPRLREVLWDRFAASAVDEALLWNPYPRPGMDFGCVRGADTLVSEGARQRWPHYDYSLYVELLSPSPHSISSGLRNNPNYHPETKADLQMMAVYTDTVVLPSKYSPPMDELEMRPHKPIGIEVRETYYYWNQPFAKGFHLIDFWIKNISGAPIHDACFGYYRDFDIYGWSEDLGNTDSLRGVMLDDITGYVGVVPGIVPGSLDTMKLGWTADNDGDPLADYSQRPGGPHAVSGVRILRAPTDVQFSFNWFANDHLKTEWGPRRRGNPSTYLRSQGAPFGDRARYRVMTNGEIDYDQVFSAIDYSPYGWMPPTPDRATAVDLANGLDTRFIMSFGPLPEFAPGDSIPFTIAILTGEQFHRDPLNFLTRFHPNTPQDFIDHLDFSDLLYNARWADWVFDNPGVDTDGDGDRGAAYLVRCGGAGGCDSVFYRGDGIPDFRGPSAPPPPEVNVVTMPGKIILRWDGIYTESFVDPFSQRRDWEGYRVYAGRFDLDDQYSLISSWDVENFRRMAFQPKWDDWRPISDPLIISEWQEILGDPEFDPREFPEPEFEDAFVDIVTDTLFDLFGEVSEIKDRVRYSYWVTEDYNRPNQYTDNGLWVDNPIWRMEDRDTVMDGVPLTYGVYELVMDNLNPATPLFFAVTAFDFGDYERDFPPQESRPTFNSYYTEPIYTSDIVEDSNLKVTVYPNPYKSEYPDAWGRTTTYFREGYEGRGVAKFTEYDRRIHFANLPDSATIRIYSIDGDLIRTIQHPDPFLTTYSSSVGWDLVSRNSQAVVSGIYIWRVDSKLGTQVGKLVIIK